MGREVKEGIKEKMEEKPLAGSSGSYRRCTYLQFHTSPGVGRSGWPWLLATDTASRYLFPIQGAPWSAVPPLVVEVSAQGGFPAPARQPPPWNEQEGLWQIGQVAGGPSNAWERSPGPECEGGKQLGERGLRNRR